MKIDLWGMFKNSLPFLWKMWPVWMWFFIFILFALFLKWFDIEINRWIIHRRFVKGEKWRSDRDILQWLRSMKPAEFESYVADLFSRLGYKTQTIGRSHDGGIDVIAEKEGIKNYIQCKKFIISEVSVGAVRDFFGALADRLANGQGYFVTTNKFTLEARKFAEDKPIELIDGFKLVEYIRMADKDKTIGTALEKESGRCSECGGNLIERSGKYGNFFGCSNYPRCKYTKKI